MEYKNIQQAKFLARPNRFIAEIEIAGKIELCHVKNTGRCKELLVAGATIFVEESDKKGRKTKYDLISVYKAQRLINMDSQAPNQVVEEWLKAGVLFKDISLLRREAKYKNSRFDFYLEVGKRKIFLEVKGVTLEAEGIVSFPDAPTERGIKHLNELVECLQDGFEAYVIFLIQMEQVQYFKPNDMTHPAFGDALRAASEAGVVCLAYDCMVTSTTLTLHQLVALQLEKE
ncbi:MAG: DNA/RNA nuclease SfsA [Clostridia bacterium]